jgi:N-acetylneuraminate synthase
MSRRPSTAIGGKPVGNGAKAFLIAEVAQAHDGSLGLAHAFIDAAADAKADAIKFQTHVASEESTREEPFRVLFSQQDATRYDYWRRMEFAADQWAGLAEHARKRGLAFLSSAFSLHAVELLDRIGVDAWKLASGEHRSDDVLSRICATGMPVLVSTGMSPYAEIDRTITRVREGGATPIALQCTSRYPTPLAEVGLDVIDELRRRYDCPAGLSDHSGSIFPALAAMARDADVVEVHLTFDRRMFGPDTAASLTASELELLCRARDAFDEMRRSPVDKDEMAEQLSAMRSLFHRSIAPTTSLPAGTVLTRDMLTFKKPGMGIPPEDIGTVIGRRLRRDVSPEHILSWQDIDEQ